MAAATDIQILIDGVERSGMLKPNSLKLSYRLGQRATLSFTLHDTTNTYRPDIGNSLVVKWLTVTRWKGTVEGFDHEVPDGQVADNFAKITIRGVDMSQLADRFLVAETFETADQTAGDIVTLLLADYLAAEGITAGTIEDGPTVSKAIYNYVKLTDVLNEIAERCGFTWWINEQDQLNFMDRQNITASISLSDASRPFRKLRMSMSRGAFRNRQYIRGGLTQTDQRVEQFAGDGIRRNFNLIFPADSAPTITVSLVSKTVGIRGLDTGKDFYWNRGEREISQDDSATPVTDGATILVTYVGLYPLLAVGEDLGMIQDRIAAEGGTGVYEQILQDIAIDDQQLAEEKVEGLLSRYASLQPEAALEMDIADTAQFLMAGQILSMDLNPEQAYGDALLINVETVFMNAGKPADWFWRLNLKGALGPDKGGWAEFLKKLLGLSQGAAFRENEVLGAIRSAGELAEWMDSVSTADALDDGSGDPYTAVLAGDPSDDDSLEFGVDKGVVGDDPLA